MERKIPKKRNENLVNIKMEKLNPEKIDSNKLFRSNDLTINQ